MVVPTATLTFGPGVGGPKLTYRSLIDPSDVIPPVQITVNNQCTPTNLAAADPLLQLRITPSNAPALFVDNGFGSKTTGGNCGGNAGRVVSSQAIVISLGETLTSRGLGILEAREAGCAVVGPDYALSPEAAFPQALEECAAVMRWVAAEGAQWGLDPSRIVVGGDSAGGNLAAGVALRLRETDPALRLRGLLINYGVLDSRLDTPSYEEFAEGHFLTREKMRFYWDCYCPRPADRLNPLASPLRADLKGLPPVLLHIAELDVLAQDQVVLAQHHALAVVDLVLARDVRVAGAGGAAHLDDRSLVLRCLCHQTFTPRRRSSATTDSMPRLSMVLIALVDSRRRTQRRSDGSQ